MTQLKDVTFTKPEFISLKEQHDTLARLVEKYGVARLSHNWLSAIFPNGEPQIARFCRMRGITYKLNGFGCLFLRGNEK